MDICLLFFFLNGCTEAPLTEYEKMRDKEIMKNNQKMASLGIRGIVNQMKKKVQGARTMVLSFQDLYSTLRVVMVVRTMRALNKR
jgi:hypothetical protein